MLQSGNAFLNQARVVAAPEELSKYDLCLLDGPMAMYACGGAGASVVKLIKRWNNIVRGLLVRICISIILWQACSAQQYACRAILRSTDFTAYSACLVAAERML